MTQQEILEGNKVIAEFDCYVYVKFTDYGKQICKML